MQSMLLAIAYIFSILVHEYGHALAALFFRSDPVIVLQAFGGRTLFKEAATTDKQKFIITFLGPLCQGMWLLIAYWLSQYNRFGHYLQYFLSATIYINSRWLLLNLIPIEPLDGGWLVRYILEKKFGHKGYRASIIIGLVAAAVTIPFLYWQGHYWFFIVQFFIWGLYYCRLWQRAES